MSERIKTLSKILINLVYLSLPLIITSFVLIKKSTYGYSSYWNKNFKFFFFLMICLLLILVLIKKSREYYFKFFFIYLVFFTLFYLFWTQQYRLFKFAELGSSMPKYLFTNIYFFLLFLIIITAIVLQRRLPKKYQIDFFSVIYIYFFAFCFFIYQLICFGNVISFPNFFLYNSFLLILTVFLNEMLKKKSTKISLFILFFIIHFIFEIVLKLKYTPGLIPNNTVSSISNYLFDYFPIVLIHSNILYFFIAFFILELKEKLDKKAMNTRNRNIQKGIE